MSRLKEALRITESSSRLLPENWAEMRSSFRDTEAKHPIEIVGKELSASMPFLDPVTVDEVAKTR